jgi:hypothetical protein
MKKFVFASVLATAAVGMLAAPLLRAQDITIKDQSEYNAYSLASSQTDPKAKASALEGFLQTYPQSVVKKAVLSTLIETYQGLGDADKTVAAASRQLQLDPNNMEAIFASAYVKKAQCGKTMDASVCDDAAALARKGLTTTKPAEVSEADWKNQTGAAFPVFHSVIALDLALAKKDFKGAVEEYKQELMMLPAEATKSGYALFDTYLMAEAYAKIPDAVNAVWFYARAWNFFPAGNKPVVEKSLKYWYNKYHGGLDGLDDVKAKAAATVFPGDIVIKAAKTPAEKIHDIIVSTANLGSLALADKELVLAYGSKEDAEKVWAVMKDQQTPVPGMVIESTITALKVVVTEPVKPGKPAAKPADYIVKLQAPLVLTDLPSDTADVKAQQAFIAAKGVAEDTAKMGDLLTADPAKIKKIAIEVLVSTIKVAVTSDAKDAKTPDFVVNLKDPVSAKEIPAVGGAFGIQPAVELNGTYDTYTQVPATATTAQAALIVLKDGFVQPEIKKAAAVAHKPAAGHKPAAH